MVADPAKLAELAGVALKDASRFLFFDAEDTVLASSFEANTAELKPMAETLKDRDEAIKHGVVVQGTRYEVHKYHPPLVYGRTMKGAPESSEGFAICQVTPAEPGAPVRFGLITYKMPNVSARMVPLLQTFCEKHLGAALSS